MEYPYPRLNQITSLRCTKNADNTTNDALTQESGEKQAADRLFETLIKRQPSNYVVFKIFDITEMTMCHILWKKNNYPAKVFDSHNFIITTGALNEMMNKITTIPRQQSIHVRNCMSNDRIIDFTFDKSTLKAIEIISQFNNNFIVTVIKDENKKMLALMDQHAIDERIRYEQLLEEYTTLNHTIVVSMDVQCPIIMSDLPKNVCLSLVEHSKDIQRYGIKLELDKSDCLVVTSIPKCFYKTKFWRNQSEMKFLIRKLLLDMIDMTNVKYTASGTVLKTIHQMIASEACHGAIKFGQKLNQAQCIKLVKSLMDTKAPSRCAHGRPSIIPLIQLKDINSDKRRAWGKLNFASLYRNRNFRGHTRSEG